MQRARYTVVEESTLQHGTKMHKTSKTSPSAFLRSSLSSHANQASGLFTLNPQTLSHVAVFTRLKALSLTGLPHGNILESLPTEACCPPSHAQP